MVKTPLPQGFLPIPPLESGDSEALLRSADRLNRYEFERRYNAMRSLKKAELIEGVVYLPAALRFRSHAEPHGNLMDWLWTYKISTPGVELGDNPTVRLDLDNEPQPDAVLLINENCGGQARLSQDDYVEGAPELVVEIAASSVAIDLHNKKRAYRRNGVQEYIVWQVFEQRLDWFYLQQGEYVSLPVDEEGVIQSRVFPGLWLAASDLLAGNIARVLSVLQEGLASGEHGMFVQQLAEK